MSLFQVSELLGMAVKDEVVGEAFYNALAENCSDKHVAAKLQAIAAQERHHAARFGELQSELKAAKVHEEHSGQYEQYVNALLENRAFPEPKAAIAKAKKVCLLEGIEIAAHMEKDTLLFYEEMLNYVPKSHHKFVDEIINEERNHLMELTTLRSSLATV